MTTTAAIRFLRRNALGTIPRRRAAVVSKVFGRTLSDLGPAFASSGGIPVPELACALARIEVEIPTHLIHLISQWNTERATLHLALVSESQEQAAATRSGNDANALSEGLSRLICGESES